MPRYPLVQEIKHLFKESSPIRGWAEGLGGQKPAKGGKGDVDGWVLKRDEEAVLPAGLCQTAGMLEMYLLPLSPVLPPSRELGAQGFDRCWGRASHTGVEGESYYFYGCLALTTSCFLSLMSEAGWQTL